MPVRISPATIFAVCLAGCLPNDTDNTAESFFELQVDDDNFVADGISECVVSITYPEGASPGKEVRVKVFASDGSSTSSTVRTEARTEQDQSPQELLRLRSEFVPRDVKIVVEAGSDELEVWSQSEVCSSARARPDSLFLESNASTLESGGVTAANLKVTLTRPSEQGQPSADTRVFLTPCCVGSDNTSMCARWFLLPEVVASDEATPSQISQDLALSALGVGVLNEEATKPASEFEEAHIFASAMSESDKVAPTCAKLKSSLDANGFATDPLIDQFTIRLVRKTP